MSPKYVVEKLERRIKMTNTNGVFEYNNNTQCATFILNRMISTLIVLIISLGMKLRQISIQAKNKASNQKVLTLPQNL